MSKDLRYFISVLESAAPDEILRVGNQVSPIFEIPAVLRKLQSYGKYPAVIFQNVENSKFPVVTNLFATITKMATAIQAKPENYLQRFMQAEDNPIPPTHIKSGPVKDVIKTGSEVDLTKLPIVTHCEHDAGPYITMGITLSKDPETGRTNAGIYRMQLKAEEKNKLGFFFESRTFFNNIYNRAEEAGKPVEVATFIGHHPAFTYGACSRIHGREFELMGSLLNEPVQLTKCETVDLEIPAFAEIVLEGKVLPHERDPEAPFGEYPFYYGPRRDSPVMEVSAITHRKDAMYVDLFSAHPDHTLPTLPGREAALYRKIKTVMPQVRTVRCPIWGIKHLVYVQIKKDYDGQGKNAGLAALSADPTYKIVIVVDDDIDITSNDEVLWAITTRIQPYRDISIIQSAYAGDLDPSSYSILSRVNKGGLNDRVIIDATKPIGVRFEERADVPEEVWKKIDLKNYGISASKKQLTCE